MELNADEAKLFTKYYGREDLITNEDFWNDVYVYYSKEISDAPLPMVFRPATLRMLSDMLVCLSGNCGGCCNYNHIELNDYDIRRITENTKYTEERMTNLITEENGKMVMSGSPYGCFFLKENTCSIYDFRPDACWMFPFSGKQMMIDNVMIKQMQIRIRCKPAMAVARKVITEVISAGDKILLPDLTIILKGL